MGEMGDMGLRLDWIPERSLKFYIISLGGTLQSSIHPIQLHTSTMGPKRRLPAKQTSLTEAELSQVPATQVLDSVATNLAIPTPTLVVEAEDEDEPTRAPTIRKFEGDDFIELVIARRPKTSWYWQHGMEMECQKVNAKGGHDRF